MSNKRFSNAIMIMIILMTLIVLFLIWIFGMFSVAYADTGNNLIIENEDNDFAYVIKVKNISRYRKLNIRNKNHMVEKAIYEALGYTKEQISKLSDFELNKFDNVDEVDLYYSDFYTQDTSLSAYSSDEDSPQAVDVIISSPNSAENSKYVTQGLRKTMSLTMLVRRYNDLDRVETVTNKDGESTQQTYFGARIDMTLLWVSTPTTKLGDNLFIFSSVDMKSVNTVLSYKNPNEINQILNHTKNGNCYKYVANLPDQGSDYKFVGTYDYEIFQSASINFRVVYLHHTLPSEGFTNNVTINNDIMDVEVSGPVLYAKYKSYIYTLNLT